MAQMNLSNTLWNDDSSGTIALVEQLKDRLLHTYIANNPNYSTTDKNRIPAELKAEVGVFQEKLNEFFLNHWVDFQRFLLDEGVDPETIDSWKEVQEFLKGLPDDEAMWLKNKFAALDTAIAGIDQDGIGIFDVSAYNNIGGTYATYNGLSAALAAIPTASKRSGMTIRYINSTSNQYEEYRYFLQYEDTTAGNAAFNNTANWQGIDDEPTAGSDNLVKSGGVYEKVRKLDQQVDGLFAVTDADLDLGDANGNVIARFYGGHIKTPNFDSKDLVDKGIMSMPNKIDSLSSNKFQLNTKHTYNLLNPSDFDGVDSGFIPISIDDGVCIHMHFLDYIQYKKETNTRESITINPFSTLCKFYDSNKNIISADATISYVKMIPNNAAFVKVRLIDAKYKDVAFLSYDVADATVNYSRGGIEHREYPKEFGFTKTGYEDFTIVCFGDSITQGLSRKPLNISYVSYLEDILHCHTINVGFGGTRMAYVGSTPLFSFANLVDVIVSDATDKWDALDEYVETTLPAFTKHLNNLKNIDWNKVDAISVFYGMNDYAYQANGTRIGEEGTMDKKTFNGACAYGLNKLLTKYPWLQVILITPYDRYMDANTNSSNTANSVGKYMKDYADSLVGVQNIFRCPILDFYRESNINKYSYQTMLADGVHAYVYPTVKRLAKMLAECIMNKLY